MAMNSSELARRCLRRLTRDDSGAPSYPWIAMGRRIITPAELIALPNEEIKSWPGGCGSFNTPDIIWSCRIWARIVAGMQSRPECGVQIPTLQNWQMDRLETPVILFWPPYHADDWPELITWLGKRDEVTDCLMWLIQQPLAPYAGAREPMYSSTILINPLPLGDLFENVGSDE